MTNWQKTTLLLLRLALGWVFLYAGLTKVLNPEWTAAGYLKGAKTFTDLYQWFAADANIGWVSFLNQWGQVLIGTAMILGVGVRIASWGGALMMLLYYFPVLVFPKIGANSYLVDEHIIYALVFLVFGALGAQSTWGVSAWLKSKGWLQKPAWLAKILG
ncbi:MAG TPA: DoxX family membrane protein [Patescibacteria group bacterium]|nr:DoxX family membrane protein [Patescibacteria group bacterium]